MKKVLLTLCILIVSIIVVLRLITSSGTETAPDFSQLNQKRYDTENPPFRDNDHTRYGQSTDAGINNRKLMAFAKTFVEVQSYMNEAGNRADYKETKKIVLHNGLGVDDYTRIAERMNKSAEFKTKVQKMINKIK